MMKLVGLCLLVTLSLSFSLESIAAAGGCGTQPYFDQNEAGCKKAGFKKPKSGL